MNIHDSSINRITRDYENNRLEILAITYDKTKKILITFENVRATILSNDIEKCIIFGIDEIEPGKFVKEYGLIKVKNDIKFGLNIKGNDANEILEYIRKEKIKIIDLRSSFGLNGYILCENISIHENEH